MKEMNIPVGVSDFEEIRILLNNYDTCEAGEETIRLQPYQCLVLKVKE